MQNKTWTTRDIPNLSGKVAIITGANSGLGFESALEMARKGATVILAVRNLGRGRAALDKITTELEGGSLEQMKLDLSDQESIKQFVNDFNQKYDRLDILLNNAGIMAVPQGKTAQGFELQLGVNHLGHFALTGLLMDKLLSTPGSRVVNVSSKAANGGKMNFDDLMSEEKYSPIGAYSQSKLANLLFTFELQRRLEEVGAGTIALAAHPGGSKTNLANASDFGPFFRFIMNNFMMKLVQEAEKGALPQLFAATAPDAKPAQYYGPNGFMEMRGSHPKEADIPSQALNAEDARKLWEISEKLTAVSYGFLEKKPSLI
ncbi:MAG: SDR family oxidoreductase [Bacteroidetes bacterium]|nr:SDR family oxidoreductase [Bacteroidota bacterium]